MIDIPTSAKYEIIHEMVSREDNELTVVQMCEIAQVSRSGYYNYLACSDKRREKEEQARRDFEKILATYQHRGYKKGAKSIYMNLLHMQPPEHMNIKKIRRLMKKYDMRCPVRKANPHRRIAKALKTSNVADNFLNREFEERGPRKVLLTDITYIINGKAPRCYMSTIIDGCTKELLSWVLSDSLEIDFVLETVNKLIDEYGFSLISDTLIHSDQGSHYTMCQIH